MSSVVHFKMASKRAPSTIKFAGNQIRLLDLQRLIMEHQNMKQGMDFDLIISDADNSSKIFSGDDTYIPKNSSVVVKRVPKSKGTGLLHRLKGDAAYVAIAITNKFYIQPVSHPSYRLCHVVSPWSTLFSLPSLCAFQG